jgi:hypothetical protein
MDTTVFVAILFVVGFCRKVKKAQYNRRLIVVNFDVIFG